MTQVTFYKDYKDNAKLRTSFNELATLTFGLNFEQWYANGYWNERYIPYSYVDGEKVVANVSVNIVDFVVNGEKKSAIQIGTVMTHPDYRNQGLSAGLMNKVLAEYENQYDFMYLFANPTVLDFYPKFGFQRANEDQFSMDYSPVQSNNSGIRKLDSNSKEELDFIYKLACERVPVSNRFGTTNTEALLMFYCLYVFKQDLYYVEEEEAVVIYKTEGTQVDIFDIVSTKEVNIDRVLSKITHRDTNKIVFHYTPDYEGMAIQSEMHQGDNVLFVKTNGHFDYLAQVKHPITSIA